ncbi:MAG: ATP-binding protein [Bacteroidales bacterium]|nr:ATP-binding protein [Bacteroidales bacterium]
MKNIVVDNFGPIRHVDVEFGDLTILVGAQASGKSLFLELAKLMEDKDAIVHNLLKFNYILNRKNQKNLLDIYFGEGLSELWKDNSRITIDGERKYPKVTPIENLNNEIKEKIFYIPAQRILSMSEGRPRSFTEYDPSCPYVLRQFSETVRLFMANGFGYGNDVLFPISTRLKKFQRQSFDKTIFHGAQVVMDTQSIQRKMKLKIDGLDMPFMTWSAGQKEFMPLLMGFYCLSGPPTKVIKKEEYEYVILEEPEMGLHPQAIKAILMQILELIQSGYKVVISTHSSIPLEFAWAFNYIKESCRLNKELGLMRLFDRSEDNAAWLRGIFNKTIKTYYFSRENGGVISKDISSLEPDSLDTDISEWGGLTTFATEAGNVVSQFYEDDDIDYCAEGE